MTDLFERLFTASGLPPIRLHDLRHGAATLMPAADIDIKIGRTPSGTVTAASRGTFIKASCPRSARTPPRPPRSWSPSSARLRRPRPRPSGRGRRARSTTAPLTHASPRHPGRAPHHAPSRAKPQVTGYVTGGLSEPPSGFELESHTLVWAHSELRRLSQRPGGLKRRQADTAMPEAACIGGTARQAESGAARSAP